MKPSPELLAAVEAAGPYTYADGRADAAGRDPVTAAHRPFEARIALDNWTAAASDHAETSYWGIAHIRAMRAYWLGALRELRERKP